MSGHLMREPVRRAGLATALVAGAALLSGCTVTGDLWLTAEDLRLDLRVRHAKYSDGPAPCTEGGRGELGLTPVVVEQTDTEVACTIAGAVSLTSPTERENWVNFLVGPAGDDLMLLVPPGSFFPADGPQTTLDLTVHLPGDVVAAGGGLRRSRAGPCGSPTPRRWAARAWPSPCAPPPGSPPGCSRRELDWRSAGSPWGPPHDCGAVDRPSSHAPCRRRDRRHPRRPGHPWSSSGSNPRPTCRPRTRRSGRSPDQAPRPMPRGRRSGSQPSRCSAASNANRSVMPPT